MPAQFIGDGYNAVKTFEKNPFYPRTVVHYRPLTGTEQRLLRLKINEAERPSGRPLTEESIKAGERISAEFIAGRIQSWDVLDGGGHTIAVSAKAVQALEPHLAADLLNLMLGELPPDGEPDQPEPPEQTAAEREEAAAKN